jgi:hypothetical protein
VVGSIESQPLGVGKRLEIVRVNSGRQGYRAVQPWFRSEFDTPPGQANPALGQPVRKIPALRTEPNHLLNINERIKLGRTQKQEHGFLWTVV